MTKQYDRVYFDKWYRSPRHRVHDPGEVRRKVHLAVTMTEYFLHRPVERVLDIGAGEGAWHSYLQLLRRRAYYLGVDPSDYVVEEFGRRRNIVKSTFGGLARLRIRESFDLVICSDVLHYLTEAEIRRGLPELVRLTGGLAFIEVLTREDEIIGDLDQLTRRPASWYKRLFAKAGLTHAGPYCWLSKETRDMATELEIP